MRLGVQTAPGRRWPSCGPPAMAVDGWMLHATSWSHSQCSRPTLHQSFEQHSRLRQEIPGPSRLVPEPCSVAAGGQPLVQHFGSQEMVDRAAQALTKVRNYAVHARGDQRCREIAGVICVPSLKGLPAPNTAASRSAGRYHVAQLPRKAEHLIAFLGINVIHISRKESPPSSAAAIRPVHFLTSARRCRAPPASPGIPARQPP